VTEESIQPRRSERRAEQQQPVGANINASTTAGWQDGPQHRFCSCHSGILTIRPSLLCPVVLEEVWDCQMPPSVPLASVVVADYVVAPLLNEDQPPHGPLGTPYATFIAPFLVPRERGLTSIFITRTLRARESHASKRQ
jgi:hypothetical protein